MDAVISSSLGAIGSLHGKLELLISPRFLLQQPLKDAIMLLKQNIERAKDYLDHLLIVGRTSNMMSTRWMNSMRDLSYEIEDYIVTAMHSNFSGITDKQVNEFTSLVREAIERHDRYMGQPPDASSLSGKAKEPRLVPMLNGEVMDLDCIHSLKKELIVNLSDGAGSQLKLLSILGPPGVGKSTLAKEIYREIGGHFECHAFVRASKKSDTRRLLRSMISQVQRQQRPPYACTVQYLIDKLREHLQQKRYFIVIDCLLETTSWHIINRAFPEGTDGSRILITTDREEVALECSSQSGSLFKKEPLRKDDSIKLFDKLFDSEHEFLQPLKKDSEEIIERCGGLPLSVISIASILSTVQDSFDYVQHCLTSIVEKNFSSEYILRELLGLSYSCLSHHLKTCLVYLSMYPEGYMFLKTELVRQWTAESFVVPKEGKDTYEVAEHYLDELVCRGFIQPIPINFSDEVIFYTVHTTVYHVIRLKSIEDSFTTVIDYSESIPMLSFNVRRLSLTFSNTKYATKPEGIRISTVRSLNFYGLYKCLPSIMELKELRVLILECWDDKKELDLSGIEKLFQLRYIRVCSDNNVKLPATMLRLECLETLELHARVSSDIVLPPHLLHLCLEGVTSLPDDVRYMTSLRTLQSFDVGCNSEDNVRSLGKMSSLQDLHLTCSTEWSQDLHRNLIALISTLGKLSSLKSLIFSPNTLFTSNLPDCLGSESPLPIYLQRLELLSSFCIFSRLPKCIEKLQELRILKIIVRELTTDDHNSISKLKELTALSMHIRKKTGESIVFKPASFIALKYLKLRCCDMRLSFEVESLPNIRSLSLEFNAHNGKQYGDMLGGIGNLVNLQEIVVQIGSAPDAEESNRTTIESLLKDVTKKHSRPPRLRIGSIDLVEEEYTKFSTSPETSVRSVNKDTNMGAIDSELKDTGMTAIDAELKDTERTAKEHELRDTDMTAIDPELKGTDMSHMTAIDPELKDADMAAIDSELKGTISKHSGPSNVGRVDAVEERYTLFSTSPESSANSVIDVGSAPGAQDSNWTAIDSEHEGTISKHPRPSNLRVGTFDSAKEERTQFSVQPEKAARSARPASVTVCMQPKPYKTGSTTSTSSWWRRPRAARFRGAAAAKQHDEQHVFTALTPSSNTTSSTSSLWERR